MACLRSPLVHFLGGWYFQTLIVTGKITESINLLQTSLQAPDHQSCKAHIHSTLQNVCHIATILLSPGSWQNQICEDNSST